MDPPPAPKADPQPFPTLPLLDPAAPHEFTTPTKRINEGTDVDRFLTSRAYRDIGVFIMQLNRAVCPRRVPGPRREMARTWGLDTLSERELPASVKGVREVLRRAGEVVGEVPPDKGPRRFGNVSFRRWFDVVEERVDGWLGELIPEEVLNFGGKKDESGEEEGEKKDGARDELKAYLLGSFGSKQRMDYGTGHELSFLAFLGCLWKLGAFKDGKPGGEIERQIVLGVFEPYVALPASHIMPSIRTHVPALHGTYKTDLSRYLKVIRRLILTYTLEPAGSHGVWGLDDHSFLPYVFGSAQLTRPITDDEPMPLEGSVRGAPKAGDVIKGDVVGEERERNMYFSAIGFINDVKSGPFWEHSPILFDISGVQDGWGKINKVSLRPRFPPIHSAGSLLYFTFSFPTSCLHPALISYFVLLELGE